MEHASKVWRYDHMSGRMLSGIPIELGLIQSVFIRETSVPLKKYPMSQTGLIQRGPATQP